MNNFFKNATVWIVMGIVMLTVFNSFSPNSVRQQTIDYTTFLELVRTGNISEVVFENDVIIEDEKKNYIKIRCRTL